MVEPATTPDFIDETAKSTCTICHNSLPNKGLTIPGSINGQADHPAN